MTETTAWNASSVFASADDLAATVPVYLVQQDADLQKMGLNASQCAWLEAQKFSGASQEIDFAS